MARSAPGASRDQCSDGNPGRVPMPSRDGVRRAKPADPHAFAGRRPRPELAGNRARTLGARVLHGRTLLRSRPYPARAPSLRSRRVSPFSRRFPSVSVTRACLCTESDGAQGEGHVPTVGVRSCSGRLRTDAKRRPRATWAGLPARSRSSDGRGMSFPRCSRPRAEAERRSPESRVRLPQAPTASAQWRRHRSERSCPPWG